MQRSHAHSFARLTVCAALALGALGAGAAPAGAATVGGSLSALESAGRIDPAQAQSARAGYLAARSLRKRLSGARRLPLDNQLRSLEALAKRNRLTAGRVRPLFAQLEVNVGWFATRGPAVDGTRSRFGTSRIYYQYFAGWGWQFHPLANFARLNAIWSDRSAAARRSLGAFAHELIDFGAVRGGALTWEYYFPFSGSAAPFISSISQGTAIQALARAGAALNDPAITAAARSGAKAFGVAAPTGLMTARDGGVHFLGYSGNSRAIIFNMFAQALVGLHDYVAITGDAGAAELYDRGLVAARVELPQSDTGAWSLYELGGAESNLNYHRVLVDFLARLCADSGEQVFCGLHDRLAAYLTTPPALSGVTKRIRGRRIVVSFRLSKVSTVTVSSSGGSATATVGRGKRIFIVPRGRSNAVTITVKDLAGNAVLVDR
jgi:hypothetical protein